MSQIAVEKVREEGVLAKVEAALERVRRRAFHIFEGRGGSEGFALDDWLAAERELLGRTESECRAVDGRFEISVAVPGFDANEVNVTALPYSVIVRAGAIHSRESADGDVAASEFEEKTLLRRFDLPEGIDPDAVTASLDNGMLQVTAPKASASAPASQTAAA